MIQQVFVVVLLAVVVPTHQSQHSCSDHSSSVNVAVTGHRKPSGHWVSQVVVGDSEPDQAGNLEVDVQYREKKMCSSEETRSDIVLTFSVPSADRGSSYHHDNHPPRPVSVYEGQAQGRRRKYPPAGYLGLQDTGYFKIYLTPATWSTARHQCNEDGGHLASINTQEKLVFVKTLNPIPKWAWIDIHETGVHNVWYNATGHRWEQPSFLTWHPPYPNNPSGSDCGMILLGDGRLSDWHCEQNKAEYVCEIPWAWV